MPSWPLEAAEDIVADQLNDGTMIQLGETLAELAELDPELARLVDCRYFAGLTEEEAAQVMGVSERTIRRRWARARAFIHRSMASG